MKKSPIHNWVDCRSLSWTDVLSGVLEDPNVSLKSVKQLKLFLINTPITLGLLVFGKVNL